MKRPFHRYSAVVTFVMFSLLLLARPAPAQLFCVYDPLGAGGDFYSMAKDYQLAASRWNVKLELKAYTDEAQAVADFRADKCDMLDMIGFRALEFNKFSGTLDSVGALESYEDLRDALKILALPVLAKFMVSGDYETVGIVPLGAGYPMVHDRNINSLGKVAGKKIAVLDFDRTESIFVEQVHAIPVKTDFNNYGRLFNTGEVDAIVAPIALVKPLELTKGLGEKGGIVRRTADEITLQFVMKRDRFPADYGQQSREYMIGLVPGALTVIHKLENELDPRYWLYTLSSEKVDFYNIMRVSRAHMTKAGYFDHHMLAILKRVRCHNHDDDSECALPDE